MAYILHHNDFRETYIELMDWPNWNMMGDVSNEESEFDSLLSFEIKVNE
jgi:hypothetical protein